MKIESIMASQSVLSRCEHPGALGVQSTHLNGGAAKRGVRAMPTTPGPQGDSKAGGS
jgi:hypothetical protein